MQSMKLNKKKSRVHLSASNDATFLLKHSTDGHNKEAKNYHETVQIRLPLLHLFCLSIGSGCVWLNINSGRDVTQHDRQMNEQEIFQPTPSRPVLTPRK